MVCIDWPGASLSLTKRFQRLSSSALSYHRAPVVGRGSGQGRKGRDAKKRALVTKSSGWKGPHTKGQDPKVDPACSCRNSRERDRPAMRWNVPEPPATTPST
eukprot:10393-Heterococcus_DN1.PRE.1